MEPPWDSLGSRAGESACPCRASLGLTIPPVSKEGAPSPQLKEGKRCEGLWDSYLPGSCHHEGIPRDLSKILSPPGVCQSAGLLCGFFVLFFWYQIKLGPLCL